MERNVVNFLTLSVSTVHKIFWTVTFVAAVCYEHCSKNHKLCAWKCPSNLQYGDPDGCLCDSDDITGSIGISWSGQVFGWKRRDKGQACLANNENAHHNKTRTCCCVYLNAARGILVCLGKLLNAQQGAVQDRQSENSVCCGCLFAALQPGSAVAMFQSVQGVTLVGFRCKISIFQPD